MPYVFIKMAILWSWRRLRHNSSCSLTWLRKSSITSSHLSKKWRLKSWQIRSDALRPTQVLQSALESLSRCIVETNLRVARNICARPTPGCMSCYQWSKAKQMVTYWVNWLATLTSQQLRCSAKFKALSASNQTSLCRFWDTRQTRSTTGWSEQTNWFWSTI